MADVGPKEVSSRSAHARGWLQMEAATLAMIRDGSVGKGDVLGVARLAGIMAAKRTADLIPLCHPIALDSVEVDLTPCDDRSLRIDARVRCQGRTGVEMEALTAVSVAALTVYDMCKAVDRGMTIERIGLESKSGGASGDFRRTADSGRAGRGDADIA